MNKRIIRSVMLASLLVVNGSQNTVVNAAISGTNYNSCYSAGEKAFALSDFVNAADNFAEALKYKPDDLRSHLKYAQSLSSLNKYDESSIHLKTILQNSPNNILARICLAENYLHLGKKDCAKEQLDWILKVQPNHQKAISLYESLGYTPSNKVKVSQAPIVKKEIIKKNTELPKPVTVKEEIKNKLDNDQLKIAKNTKEDTKLDNSQLKVSENIKEDAKLDNSQLKIAENIKEDKKESITIKENDSDDSMTFTPYIASNKKKVEKKDQDFEEKPKMPLAREDIQNIDMTSFFKLAKNSFIVNLEKARYEIESGDLKSAVKTLEISEKLARAGNNNRNLLETQIFKSLLYIYNCDYKNFGKHLMTLKSVLSTESYQSFLDIYSKADDIKNEDDKKRLSAGVAIGAGHYAVAVSLLKPVFDKNPDNFPVYEMLLESQLNSMNYNGAEETLKKFVEINPDDEEANFNLSRFYLTGSYNPELAKKYAEKASELSPKDARPKIIIALTDYSEGKVEEGISKIKTLMSELEDASMKAICQRLVTDGENLSSESKENFVSMIALPGSKFSEPSSLRFVGEDYLKAGSYFSAIDKFKRADEKVEMGRAYLGLASSLASSNDSEVASIAAGYGLTLIKEDMSRGKNISRASLYKALYDFERGDKESALACIDLGLNCKDLDLSTYNKLVNLYDNLSL